MVPHGGVHIDGQRCRSVARGVAWRSSFVQRAGSACGAFGVGRSGWASRRRSRGDCSRGSDRCAGRRRSSKRIAVARRGWPSDRHDRSGGVDAVAGARGRLDQGDCLHRQKQGSGAATGCMEPCGCRRCGTTHPSPTGGDSWALSRTATGRRRPICNAAGT